MPIKIPVKMAGNKAAKGAAAAARGRAGGMAAGVAAVARTGQAARVEQGAAAVSKFSGAARSKQGAAAVSRFGGAARTKAGAAAVSRSAAPVSRTPVIRAPKAPVAMPPPPKAPSLFAGRGKMAAAAVVAGGVAYGTIRNRTGRAVDKQTGLPRGMYNY